MQRLPTDRLIQKGPMKRCLLLIGRSTIKLLLSQQGSVELDLTLRWRREAVRLPALMGECAPLCVPKWRRNDSHTTSQRLASRPAGKYLACTKKSARVNVHPDAGLLECVSHSNSTFSFCCTNTFMSWSQSGMFSVCLAHVHFGPIYRLLGTLGGGLLI